MNFLALDIETDTSPVTDAEKAAGFTARGLVPQITPVTAVAFAEEGGVWVRQATVQRERSLLAEVDQAVAARAARDPDLVLVTWNGAVFDLPFLADRARILGRAPGWFSGLVLTPDPAFVPKYDPLPGHAGGYRALWHGLKHIDLAYVVRDHAARHGIAWSLKPYVKAVLGLDPVEVDREAMHELSPAELDAYVASDAHVTLQLARFASEQGWLATGRS